jgi:hypothetical protein
MYTKNVGEGKPFVHRATLSGRGPERKPPDADVTGSTSEVTAAPRTVDVCR